MKYLLDTNILSELVKPAPNPGVVQWVESVPEEDLFVSALVIGEIRKGAEEMADPGKRARFRTWLDQEIKPRFEGRILPLDTSCAETWGSIIAGKGRSVPTTDSLIAATAMTHGMAVATRNVRNFQFEGLRVINPFDHKANP